MEKINDDFLSAIRQNNLSLVKLLINEADLNYKDKFGDSALWYAVCANSLDILKLIVDKGVDINRRFGKKKNVLHVAVEYHGKLYHSSDIIEFLVARGIDLNAQDTYGNTPLFYACVAYTLNIDVIKLLVNNGADMDLINKYGYSPHSMAIKNEMAELQILLESLK